MTRSRLRRAFAVPAAATIAAGALLALTPTSAHADTLPENLQKYANCPVQDPNVTSCVFIDAGHTKIQMGDWDLDTNAPITLEFGTDKFGNVVAPINGQTVLTADPIEVPGGITGIPGADVGPLAAYATPELIGLPKVSIPNMIQESGVAFEINLKAKISNPFTDFLTILGTKCTIGSDSDPIPLRLTTGTTAPPAPNQPASGTRGTPTTVGQPIGGIKFDGLTGVDNSFRAPGAHSCGLTGALNGVINQQGAVPAAAGTNTAILDATVYQVPATTLRNALNEPGNNAANAGFEASGMAPWACIAQCGVDEGAGNAHSGANNGWVRNDNDEWNDIHQSVSVAPNTDYTLTGWVRSSASNSDGYFGVRKPGGTVISEQKFGHLSGYTQQTVHFNSGNASKVVVYGGVWALHGDTWAQLDDISVSAD